MSLSFTTRKRIRPEMIRKTNLDGVCLVYSGTEERSIYIPSKASSNETINESSNETNNTVIVRQPTETIQPTDTIPPAKTENDDVIIDTLEFDCFVCYRWWFCKDIRSIK